MARSGIKRVLERVLVVAKEDLETTYIVHSQPLSELIELMGVENPNVVNLSERTTGSSHYIPPRPLHEVPPLSQLAEPLGMELWVRFYEINGIPIYFINEPPIDELTLRVYVYLRQRLGEIGVSSPSEMLAFVSDMFEDLGIRPRVAFAEDSVKSALYYVFRDMLGYGPLELPMEDTYVEEISWFSHDGPIKVVDSKLASIYPNLEFMDTNIFLDRTLSELEAKFYMSQTMRAVASKARIGLTTARPIAEARIPDPGGRGFHRLAVHLDIVSRSPALTIRKFPKRKLSITELIKYGTVSALEASYMIWQLVNRGFILIVGGMASGKSVTGDTFLLARVDGVTKLLTFEELWDEVSASSVPSRINEMEVIEPRNIEVLSIANGRARWVKPKFLIRHKYSGKIYRVTTRSGRVVRVTPDHSLLVWSTRNTSSEVSVGLEERKPEQVKHGTVYLPYARTIEIPVSGVDVPPVVSSDEFAYVLGVYTVKGYNGGYVVSIFDDEVAERVINILKTLKLEFTVKYRYKSDDVVVTEIRLGRGGRELLKSLGVTGLVKNREIPTIFWNMGESWRASFIAGVVDVVGGINVDGRKVELRTASKRLAYGLLYALASIGVPSAIKHRVTHGKTYYTVYIPIEKSRRLDKLVSRLTRSKREGIISIINNSNWHRSGFDRAPPEVAFAVARMYESSAGGCCNARVVVELKSHMYAGVEIPMSRLEELVGEKLAEMIPSNVGFDLVTGVQTEEYSGYVYDIEVLNHQNFEAGGIYVHNTTLLQALISALPVSYKVVTIEDTPELSTPSQNWHPLYVRRAPLGSELEDINYSRLVTHSLRHRGTIVTLGEVRGEEMSDLIQASASGHGAICLPGETPIVVRSKKNTKPAIMPIRRVVELVESGEELEALSLNMRTGKREWRPIIGGIRVSTDIWVAVETETGRRIKMTEDHRAVVVDPDSGKLSFKPAGELKVGDVIPIVTRVPSPNTALYVIVNGVYILLSRGLGRVYGEVLKAGLGQNRYVLPGELHAVLSNLPIRIAYTNRGSTLYLKSVKFAKLIQEITSTVEKRYLELPYYFASGLGEALEGHTIKVHDKAFGWKLHYVLKIAGYDSIFSEDSLELRVVGRRDGELITERIVKIERVKSDNTDAYDIEVEGNHNFVAGESIVTGNCTFHANDPEGILARITSPPINASPESLKLITSVVHIARTKTYAGGAPTTVRRVIRTFEITEVKGSEVESRVIFRWNPLTDTHTPLGTEKGVVALWNSSRVLKTIGYNIYVDEAPKAVVEVYAIAKYLEALLKRNVLNIEDVTYSMTKLYLNLDRIVDRLWRERFKELLQKQSAMATAH